MSNFETHSFTGPTSIRIGPAAGGRAAEVAQSNWRGNLAELARVQPLLVQQVYELSPMVEWVFARDGALTCLDSSRRWFGGCSVPNRTAKSLLRKLELTGQTGCFLAPAHAEQLAVALDHLSPNQAVIAAFTSAGELWTALHCRNFADAIAVHRLWFLAGDDWAAQMESLLRDWPGLNPPTQLIRTGLLAEEVSKSMAAQAEAALQRDAAWRSAEIQRCISSSGTAGDELALICPSRFRLWNDEATILAEILQESGRGVRVIDPDDPANSSPLAVAQAARGCAAVVAANLTRPDLPRVIAPHVPLITWMTRPRVTAFDSAGAKDAVLVAEESWIAALRNAGWPDGRLAVADWPAAKLPDRNREPLLAAVADTRPVPPTVRFDLSSQRLLWEIIYQQIHENPLCVGGDALAYLQRCMAELSVEPATLDQRRFLEELILPLYQQTLVRRLHEAGLPICLYGKGWEQLGGFAGLHRGPIESREQLLEAVAGVAGLVSLTLGDAGYAERSLCRPVVRGGVRMNDWVRAGRTVIAAPENCPESTPCAITFDRIAAMIAVA